MIDGYESEDDEYDWDELRETVQTLDHAQMHPVGIDTSEPDESQEPSLAEQIATWGMVGILTGMGLAFCALISYVILANIETVATIVAGVAVLFCVAVALGYVVDRLL